MAPAWMNDRLYLTLLVTSTCFWQCASIRTRARDGAVGEPADLLWLDEPDEVLLGLENNVTFSSFPESLRGKRLVFIGDSNDRTLLSFLSKSHGLGCDHITLLDNGMTFTSKTSMLDCNFSRDEVVVSYVWHGGVMSIPPQPAWHQLQVQGGGAPNRAKMVAQKPDGTKVPDPMYIIPAALDHLWHMADLPLVAVVQSSLWDSVPAQEARHLANVSKALQEFEKWNWLGRASTMVRMVAQDPRVERLHWRTTANCPDTSNHGEGDKGWINLITEKQAVAVRGAIEQHAEPWDKVRLIDWRRDYETALCSDIHYHKEGYVSLFEHITSAMEK